MDDRLAWFSIGALCAFVICGWPWHPRFSRYERLRRGSNPPPPGGKPTPPRGPHGLLIPPPDVAEAINRQLDRKIAAERYRRRAAPPSGPPSVDFRALCAELVQAWEEGFDVAGPMQRARAILARQGGRPTPAKPQPTGGRLIRGDRCPPPIRGSESPLSEFGPGETPLG
jgi:hypothetical protein